MPYEQPATTQKKIGLHSQFLKKNRVGRKKLGWLGN